MAPVPVPAPGRDRVSSLLEWSLSKTRRSCLISLPGCPCGAAAGRRLSPRSPRAAPAARSAAPRRERTAAGGKVPGPGQKVTSRPRPRSAVIPGENRISPTPPASRFGDGETLGRRSRAAPLRRQGETPVRQGCAE